MKSFTQDAIALLLDLAERGEIDPWDVQVVEAIDHHLSPLLEKLELAALAATATATTIETPSPQTPNHSDAWDVLTLTARSPYGADLSRSGQTFLYASMLLLLKADALVRSESGEADAPEEEAWNLDDAADALPIALERQLRRRAIAPPRRKRPVTLQEMITQIRLMEKTLADQPPRRRSPRVLRPSNRQAAQQIGQLAHEENLTETAAEIDRFLAKHWTEIAQGQDWINLEQLLAAWQPHAQSALSPAQMGQATHTIQATAPPIDPATIQEQETAQATQAAAQTSNQAARLETISDTMPETAQATAHAQVGAFWALLLLASQSRLELSQAEFYGDIKLRPIVPAIDTAAS